MDYQQMNQPAGQPMSQPPMESDSSKMVWYVVAVAVVIALLGYWYYSSQMPGQNLAPTAELQMSALSGGNSVFDIANDLDQTVDTFTGLDQAAAASVQSIQSF